MSKVDDKFDDETAHATPVIRKDRQYGLAEEQETGGHFEGESLRERKVGIEREIVVDLFKRRLGKNKGSYFVRVSLRSQMRYGLIYRSDVDLDRYTSEREFLNVVELSGGALAEHDNEHGAKWDTEYTAKQARKAAAELLHDIEEQG